MINWAYIQDITVYISDVQTVVLLWPADLCVVPDGVF